MTKYSTQYYVGIADDADHPEIVKSLKGWSAGSTVGSAVGSIGSSCTGGRGPTSGRRSLP
jgi:hypothetical protein